MQRKKFRLIILSAALIFVPLLTSRSNGVVFRQHEIEQMLRGTGERSLLQMVEGAIGGYLGHIKSLFSEPYVPKKELRGIDEIAEQVISAMPWYAVVYPTEGYYYFRLPDPKGEIAGNIRFTWIMDGIVGMGAFRAADARGAGVSRLFFEGEEFSATRVSGGIYILRLLGHYRIVRLPVTETKRPPEVAILPEEDFVTWVRDESGVPFFLLFNREKPAFYFVLDERRAALERYENLTTDVVVGSMTKFAFYQESQISRKVLFGVSEASIGVNDYFDGPFDQIPADFPIRDRVYQAYPYLKMGGVDPYGQQCLSPSTRVAISPYASYSTSNELDERLADCRVRAHGPSALRHCLTFDEKQFYHRDSPAFLADGSLKKGAPRVCDSTSKLFLKQRDRMFSQQLLP